jgi:hypothetical protein
MGLGNPWTSCVMLKRIIYIRANVCYVIFFDLSQLILFSFRYQTFLIDINPFLRILHFLSGFRNVIILIRFVSFRFTNISFRSVSFHDIIIFLTFRFVSFQKNIVSFRNVSWSCKFYFVPFRFVSENCAFLAFRSVSFRSLYLLTNFSYNICKPAF